MSGNHNTGNGNPGNGKFKNEDFDREVKNKKIINDDKNDTLKKDSKWQEDKMNEANNQQGDKLNVDDRAGKINDLDTEEKNSQPKNTETKITEARETREDSILDRPKTETYETNQGEDVGSVVRKDNYTHTEEEKKRDEMNRKNRVKTDNKSEHTY
ncbi:MAG: hypothetical protein ABI543_09790 [Ignavibacteria bacterium]